VVKLTFALEYQIWGDKPGRSHAINILLYWLASVVLFSVLRRLLTGYNILFPFLATLLFMVHPLHTEVVASLKNRDELLAFLFGMGTLSMVLTYLEKKNPLYILIAILFFVIGYLSKSSILPFLLLIPLAIRFFTHTPGKTLLLMVAILGVVAVVAQLGPKMYLADAQRNNLFIENPLFGEKDFWIRLGTGLTSLLFYVKMMLWPHPLLYYYGFDMIPVVGMGDLKALLSLALHGGLLFMAIRGWRSKSLWSFAIFWYLIAIAMYSNVVIPVVGIVGERFAFTASLGFVIIVTALIFKLFKNDPKNLTIEMDVRLKIITVMVLIMIPGTVASINRNRDWRNLFDLYHHDIKHLNNSAKANIDYAGLLMNSVYQDENFIRHGAVNQYKYQKIVTHFRRAIELYPDNYKTINDLGTVYLFIGKNYDSAVYFLQKAIALDSTKQPAWVNLGMAYKENKEYDKALACYERILKIDPNQVKAVFAMANVYHDMGDFDRAVRMNEEMIRKYPELEMPYINIGNYHMLRKDTATAVFYWEKAAAIRPSFELCVQLNSMYLIKGDKQKADYYYDLGIALSRESQ
jgi:tetratricopeptide (TPR) repeat protein